MEGFNLNRGLSNPNRTYHSSNKQLPAVHFAETVKNYSREVIPTVSALLINAIPIAVGRLKLY